MSIYKNVKSTLTRIEQDYILEDGTYAFNDLTPVSFTEGFQVSFVRPEANRLLSEEGWDIITSYLSDKTHSDVYIGVYNKSVEISFRCMDRELTMEIMYLYNQESALSWEALSKGDIDAMLIYNPYYDKNREVDYDEIIKKI